MSDKFAITTRDLCLWYAKFQALINVNVASDGTVLEPGDRVVPAPNRACGTCRMCQRGFPYYLCERLESTTT